MFNMGESESDGPEVKATLKSSRIILDAMIRNVHTPTSSAVEWFIYHIDDLLQFSRRRQTYQKLQKIIKAMKRAKSKIRGKNVHADFYTFARQALILIDEILKA